MRNSALACPGVRAIGMTAGMIGDGLTPNPPASTIPPRPSLGAVPEEVDD